MGQADYKFRYAFTVTGNEVKVTREGKPVDVTFSITDKDGKDSASPLHLYLESIGRPRGDAHMVCVEVEQGHSVDGVFGNK